MRPLLYIGAGDDDKDDDGDDDDDDDDNDDGGGDDGGDPVSTVWYGLFTLVTNISGFIAKLELRLSNSWLIRINRLSSAACLLLDTSSSSVLGDHTVC